MNWHRNKGVKKSSSRPLADYDRLPTHAPAAPESEAIIPDVVNYPLAVDPETGHVEQIGKGRVAVIGAAGVERLVTFPPSDEDDLIGKAVASGDLTYGA